MVSESMKIRWIIILPCGWNRNGNTVAISSDSIRGRMGNDEGVLEPQRQGGSDIIGQHTKRRT